MRVYSFWEPYVTLHGLILACTFINLKETMLPARLLKPAPFWILLLILIEKKVKSAEIATKMLQQPRINFDKKFPF